MVCTALCDNLVLQSVSTYTVDTRGTRVYTPPTETAITYTCQLTLYPPLMLLPATWERYGYTLEDVEKTFHALDALYIWQLYLMLLSDDTFETRCSPYDIRNTNNPCTLLFATRYSMIHDISSTCGIDFRDGPSVLDTDTSEHTPFLPVVYVEQEEFDRVCEAVPLHEPSFLWMVHYCMSYEHNGAQFVPIYKKPGRVCMHRIVPEDVYHAIPVKPVHSFVTKPIFATVQGARVFLTEEACFFKLKGVKRPRPTMGGGDGRLVDSSLK